LTPEALPGGWLLRSSDAEGGRSLLVTAGEILDYRSLHRRLGSLAGRLEGELPEPLGPMAVLSRSPERIAWALFLALYSGIPILPLDPDRSAPARLLETCRVRFAFCDQGLTQALLPSIRALPADWLTRIWSDRPSPPRPIRPEQTQLLVATSGTRNASPRAVMLSAGALAAAVHASRERLGLDTGDRWLACLPLWHIGGLSILLRCLEAGAGVVLHERFDPARVRADLETANISHLSVVPPMLARLLDQAGQGPPPPTLRVVLVGGGPLSGAMGRRARDAGWPICPSYGSSETGSQVATRLGLGQDWRAGDVGPPLCGVRVQIVDDQGRPTQGAGRIRISGPTLMSGYARADGAPGEGLRDGYFDSGDLGRLDSAGRLHLLGRADDVLVSAGENIHPAEVEDLLMACPGVRDVAVTARSDPVWGDRLVALVVGDLAPGALDAWTRAHLPSRLRPRELIQVAALPRDGLGKLQRRALAALLPHASGRSATRSTRDPAEP